MTDYRPGSLAHDVTAIDTCGACPIDQDCCKNLTRLRVTPAEYERLFAQHAERFIIEDRGLYLILSARAESPCPYWKDGCSTYLDRPVECRLYPHTISHVEASDERVDVHVHAVTPCPGKATLLHTREAVEDLCRDFVDDTALRGRRITVHVHGMHRTAMRVRNAVTRGTRRLTVGLRSADSPKNLLPSRTLATEGTAEI